MLLAFIAFYKRYDQRFLKFAGLFALVPAIGFLTLWMFGLRTTGFEVSSDDKRIWWNHMRPLHAAIYAAFAFLAAYLASPDAYSALVLDAGVGIGAFLRTPQ